MQVVLFSSVTNPMINAKCETWDPLAGTERSAASAKKYKMINDWLANERFK
jgi:hypothetical protein